MLSPTNSMSTQSSSRPHSVHPNYPSLLIAMQCTPFARPPWPTCCVNSSSHPASDIGNSLSQSQLGGMRLLASYLFMQ